MKRHLLLLVPILLMGATTAFAVACEVPNVGGTAEMPPACPEGWVGPMHIVEGLPVGSTIEIEAAINDFINVVEVPGGTLGGDVQTFDAAIHMTMAGTGDLAGFNRAITMLVTCETHSAPRTPGDAVQSFATDFISIQGDVFGDPDFDVLSIIGGTSFGLPSPGQTTLTRLGDVGGNFNVDSFFDIEYRIEFQGAPGSILEGLGGFTTSADRFTMGEDSVPAEEGSWSAVKSLY